MMLLIVLTALCLSILAPVSAAENNVQDYSLKSFAITADTFFALTTDGALIAWGDNYCSLLGDSEISSLSFEDRHIIMEDIRDIYASSFCMYAIDNSSTLYGWGTDVQGVLCGLKPEEGAFTVKLLEDVKSISCGGGYTLAVNNIMSP